MRWQTKLLRSEGLCGHIFQEQDMEMVCILPHPCSVHKDSAMTFLVQRLKDACHDPFPTVSVDGKDVRLSGLFDFSMLRDAFFYTRSTYYCTLHAPEQANRVCCKDCSEQATHVHHTPLEPDATSLDSVGREILALYRSGEELPPHVMQALEEALGLS